MTSSGITVHLPSFMLETGTAEAGPDSGHWAVTSGRPVRLSHRDYRPAPFFSVRGQASVCILGSPILGDAIDPQGVATRLPEGLGDEGFLRSLDGEFLLIVSEPGRLSLVSSRFCSPPAFYYHQGQTFLASFAFDDLWTRLTDLGLARLREDTLYHLLGYKRIFGHGTHEASTRIIEPASVLTFDGESVRSSRYYRPDFSRKTGASLTECAAELSDHIRGAIRRKTSDGCRPALFLSGGMDTRTLLAHFSDMGVTPQCFTINQFRNREVQVAARLAKLAGAPHHFLPFFENHYPAVFDKALRLVGALQHPMCMFLGFREQVAPLADVAFHGHGFDYFFQGMYLPAATPLRTSKHTLFYRYLRRLTGDVTDFFLENISYRIRDFDMDSLVRPDRLPGLKDQLRAEVRTAADEAATLCGSPYDILEYLTFYNIARHYTYADHWGINTLLPQRAISFDNALYAFYQTLPPGHRFDGRLMRTCLTRLNPAMARVISANHTYPANASSARLTLYQLRDFFLRRLGFKKSWEDEEFQRMGLPQSHALAVHLRPCVEALLDSGHLASVDFLDMDRVRDYLRNFLDNPSGNGQPVMSLVSIDRLLQRGGQRP
jgi:asparagine synthetase B (glutamine-hydrolysing)